MQETQASITQWAEDNFGVASNARLASRANQEMAELLSAVTVDEDHPKIGEEIADIIIVLCRLASYQGFDIVQEINKKMAVNRARKWANDGSGCAYHV